MVTIKGPLHFKKGFSTDEIMKKVKGKVKIKLPFEAKNWESTKMPENIDMSGITLKEQKAEKKIETKPKKAPKKKKK